MEVQSIGADLGRGYIKGYTEFKGKTKTCLFKSIVGDGRFLDYGQHEYPIHLEIENEEIFVGELAEKESYNPIPNFSDDKTSNSAKMLLYTLLNELAMSEFVKICIGVPNKSFNKTILNNVISEYKGKLVEITDKIKKTTKKVMITDITIFRESDAALMYVVNNHKDRIELKNQRVGMVTIGFRTTELSYFDKGMKFNDKLSKSKELGNRTVLESIAKYLEKNNIMKPIHEIDTESDYDELKTKGYKNLIERLNQEIEMNWINYDDMKIFLGGGTTQNFDKKLIPGKFEIVPNPQMVTAKGLFWVAESRLK